MQFLVKEKMFYRQLLLLALPIAAQNLVNFAVNMADTIMLGRLGEIPLSAAANANQLGFVFSFWVYGLGSGANVMIAQFWGRQDLPSIHKVMTLMYRFLLVGAVVFTILALFFPVAVMSVFTTDQEVISAGASFLSIVGFSYILSGITSSTMIVMRAVAAVRIALVVYLSSLVTNVVCNYLLIFGKFGFPQLGIRGAAVGTCIARAVELIILLTYLIKFEKRIGYHIRYFFMRRMGMIKSYLNTAMPVLFNEIIWSCGMAMIAVIIGRMGREFTAANSVCTVLSQLVTIAIYGVGNAAAVIIGNTIGAGKHRQAEQYARTFMVLAVLLGLCASVIVTLLKGPLLNFYNISDTAKQYAWQLMTVYSVAVIFQALAMNLLIGVLRGGGDTRFVFFADVTFMWVFCIPMGFLTGLGLGWPVWLVYAIIKCDDVFKTIAGLCRILKGHWINDISKKMET